MPSWTDGKVTLPRILSLLLVLSYVIGGYIYDGADAAFIFAVGAVLPLGCIWFGESLGGSSYAGSIPLSSPTPGCMIRAFGWTVLLLPIIIGSFLLVKRIF